MLALFYVNWPGTDTPIFMHVVNELTKGNVFAAIPQIQEHYSELG